MHLQSELQSVAARVVESPKTTAAVSTFSSLAGLATAAQWVSGILSVLAVLAGIGCSLVLMRLNWIKGENERKRGKMLEQKAADLGIDLEGED